MGKGEVGRSTGQLVFIVSTSPLYYLPPPIVACASAVCKRVFSLCSSILHEDLFLDWLLGMCGGADKVAGTAVN